MNGIYMLDPAKIESMFARVDQLEKELADLKTQKADRVMNLAEAAEFIGCATATLSGWIKADLIPCTRVEGRIMMLESELRAFVKSGRKVRITGRKKLEVKECLADLATKNPLQ